jgi:hypothetical protein
MRKVWPSDIGMIGGLRANSFEALFDDRYDVAAHLAFF